MTLLRLEYFFVIAGFFLALTALQVARDAAHPRRWGSAIFWGLLAVVFAAGKVLPPVAVGYIVVLLVLLAAMHQVSAPFAAKPDTAARSAAGERIGNRLLAPAVLIPAIVLVGGFTLDKVRCGTVMLVAPAQVTQVSLGLAVLAGLALALRITRAPARVPLQEGGRLLQVLGWTLLLPQMLAALGGIFGRAGVGEVVARLVAAGLPVELPLVAVVAYCGGMALFTMIMGNAFAAFPVVTLGIGLPFIVTAQGGNPAIMGALGMLSGYCGTLVTPMAANFNLVPALLLELEDRNAVIKTQLPMAAAIWIFNVVVMYLCVYRF
jgi:uncharacterized membrane protein